MTLKEKAALQFEAVKKQFDVQYATNVVLDTTHYEDAVQILAKEYECSKLLITKLLKFFNIKKSKEAVNNQRLSTNVSKYGKGGTKKRLELPKDSLQEMYIEERLSLEQIAARFGVSSNKVKTELARYDIHRKADYVISEATKQKRRNTCLAKYGVENPMQDSLIQAKSIQSKVDLYGEDWAHILTEKSFTTYKQRTGLDNPFQDTQHLKEVLLEKYGVENSNQIPGVKEKISAANKKTNNLLEVKEKRKNTNLNRYGVTAPAKNSEVQKKMQSTCLERYGVANIFNSPDLKYNLKKKYSKPNENFYNLLIKYFDKEEIDSGREFTIGLKQFDFKIGKYLIEINPWVTHNSDFSPYGNKVGLDKYYHQIKSKVAKEAGFQCIHVFDWDNPQDIISSILRNEVKEVIDFSEPQEIIFNYKLKCVVDIKTECCVSIFTDGACY